MTRSGSLLWRIIPAIVLLAMLVWTLWSLQDEGDTDGAVADAVTLPRYAAKGAQWVRYDDAGEPSIRVDAASIEWFDDRSAKLSTLAVDAPPSDKPEWSLRAPSGHVEAGQTILKLDGTVTGDGYWPDGLPAKVTTPTLDVDWQTHQLSTKAGVTLQSVGRTGTADALDANWTTRNVELNGSVKLRYDVR